MRFRGDERGQSVQIGAVLLFGMLIVAFSTYQAFIVPQQNERVEFNHNREVRNDMQDLRNAIVSSVDESATRSVSIQLGTTYPSRTLAVNPGPPTGSIRTAGTGDPTVALTVENASASGETADVWNGSQRNYTTGVIAYEPNYNVFSGAPRTVYDNTVLYNQFRETNLTLTGQTFVDGREISLIVLNGSLSTTGVGSESVDIRALSTSSQTVSVRASGSSNYVNITFASQLPSETWREEVLAGEFDESPGPSDGDETYVRAVKQRPGPGDFYNISVVFERGTSYSLRMTKVGVGTKTTEEPAAYLTDVSGEGATVTQGDSVDLELAVRDAFNNPVSNVSVNGSVDGGSDGSLADTRKYSGDDGRVTFTYETTGTTTTGRQEIDFSLRPVDATHDQSTAENVTMNVTVEADTAGGGGGVFTVAWERPSFSDVITSNPNGTLDRSTFRGTPFLMRATDGSEAVVGLSTDYSSTDPDNASVSPSDGETNVTGYNETRVIREADGRSTVFVAAGGVSDEVDITTDRLINESFEDDAETLVSNGWRYEPNGNGGAAGIKNEPGNAPAGDRFAYVNGSGGTSSGTRAIRLNYTLDTREYEAFTLSYVAREPTNVDDPDALAEDPPKASENLSVEYRASGGDWIEVDNVSSGGDNSNPILHHRRVRIESIDNASHVDFELRFTQGDTTLTDEWQIDAIELVGLNTSVVSDLNQDPVPAFRYGPTNPTTGDTITFWANRSDDPDDNITTYEWDWTGDGTFEVSNAAPDSDATHSYSTTGDKTVVLRVTDEEGTTATTSQTITVGSGGVASDVNLVSSTTAGGGGSIVEFDLENTGTSDATITDISLDSTTSSATQVEAPGNNPELLQNGNDRLDQVLQIDGTTYALDTSATINSGTTDTFTLDRFRDSTGSQVNMAGSDVTITLTFSDGSTESYTLSP